MTEQTPKSTASVPRPSLAASPRPIETKVEIDWDDLAAASQASPPVAVAPVAVEPVAAAIAEPDPPVAVAPSIPPPEAKPDPYIGSTFDGRYRIEGLLGEGGMGVVYRARHKVIDKLVAIKVLRADHARDAEITERFLREARAASAIGNPHIIDISDFGTLPDGSTYFVMEYLAGCPLSGLIDGKEPLPVSRIVRIAAQIADGLAAAHRRDIVHRDLKPDNVFIIERGSEKDFVKILDFGIAKVSSGTAKLTRHGSVFGTPHYMSPEQAAGAPVDLRTDIYSLGVMLYEMSAGKLPFDADNFMGILTQHMYQAPVPIRALVPTQEIPPGLEAVVMKCLSKKPEQRFQTMLELKEDLEKISQGVLPAAVNEMMARSGAFNVPADYSKSAMPVPVPATPPGLRGKSPWPVYVGIAGVLAAVAIVVGIFAYGQSSTASPNPVSAPSTTILVAAPLPTAPSALPITSVAPPATKSVMIIVNPNQAHAQVFAGEKNLGEQPVSVEVPDGTILDLIVRADGYVDQTLAVDGTETRKTIELKPKASAAKPREPGDKPPATSGNPHPVVRPPSTAKPPATTVGGGEIVNPWAH